MENKPTYRLYNSQNQQFLLKLAGAKKTCPRAALQVLVCIHSCQQVPWVARIMFVQFYRGINNFFSLSEPRKFSLSSRKLCCPKSTPNLRPIQLSLSRRAPTWRILPRKSSPPRSRTPNWWQRRKCPLFKTSWSNFFGFTVSFNSPFFSTWALTTWKDTRWVSKDNLLLSFESCPIST